jgi:hypothetical protein
MLPCYVALSIVVLYFLSSNKSTCTSIKRELPVVVYSVVTKTI